MSYMSTIYDPKKHSIYTPINTTKYLGKEKPICRSTWEYDLCRFFDLNSKILSWLSEPIGISYFDSSTAKNRKYYPDFLVKVNNNNKTSIFLVEVKPYKQICAPKMTKRKNKVKFLNEQKTFQTNVSKWKAAKSFCIKKGWQFIVLTEKEIYGR